MPITTVHETIAIGEIVISLERQRKDLGDISSLKASIRRIGLLNPIVITVEKVLVAGERRLTALREIQQEELALGSHEWDYIPVHYIDELTPVELRIAELDENIRRQDITWQEQAQAVEEIHRILSADKEKWTITSTAEYLGMHPSSVSKYLTIMSEAAESPKVLLAPTVHSALATVKRSNDRKASDVMNTVTDLIRVGLEVSPLGELDFATALSDEELDLPPIPVEPTVVPAADSIISGDCIKFMATYGGERFNLIHCDFPYGIDYNGWDKSGEFQGNYDDTPEVYWALLKALAQFWDNIVAPSSHFIFWYSMKFHEETVRFISENIPQLTIDDFPLFWLKSDNKGSLPDPNRGPRRIYETAIYGYTGDRKIVKPVGNAYAAPTQRASSIHISEKPEPVLRHFLSMMVDENTTLFDPTCGSGSSLRAAESLGAKRVIGVEKDEGYATAARKLLDSARALRG